MFDWLTNYIIEDWQTILGSLSACVVWFCIQWRRIYKAMKNGTYNRETWI